MAKTTKVETKPCPNCGHCPTCGHTPQQTLPWNPWNPYPWVTPVQPWVTTTWTTANTSTVSNFELSTGDLQC